MRELSFAEEYALCVLKHKGKQSALYTNEYSVCIIAACLLQMLTDNVINLDNNGKLFVIGELSGSKPYLKTIYDVIASGKPKKAKVLVEDYVFSISSKPLKLIVDGVIEALISNECIEIETKAGLFKEKTIYHANEKIVNIIIERIRAEFLVGGNISDETTILAALLLESKILKKYFSNDETKQLTGRIKQIKNSDARSFVKEILDDIETMMVVILVAANSVSN